MSDSPDQDTKKNGLLPKSAREIELERLFNFPDIPSEPEDEDRIAGVLLSERIERLCKKYSMIHPLNEEHLKPASYELSVGELYSRAGETFPLEPGASFEIRPFDVVLIQTLETLNLPRFLIARWNIRIAWAYRGLLWVGAPQVDPGFRGFLSCPIYNLSNQPVKLTHGDPIAAMDFVMTTPVSANSMAYQWDKRTRILFTDYEKDKLESALVTEAADKLRVMEGTTKELQSGLNEMKSSVADKDRQTQTDIADVRQKLTSTTEATRERLDNSIATVQSRLDSYTARTLTVLAVLFAALGLAVSRTPDISFLSSATPLAAVALWFALRSYYKSGAEQTSTPIRRPWFEISIGIILGLALLGIQYKLSQRYQADLAAIRSSALSAQRDVSDVRQEQANRKELQQRLDSLQQQIDALKAPPKR